MLLPYHIIIADDDLAIANLLREFISDVYPSARVTLTFNGATALAMYDAMGADLLILDINMPSLTGVQVVSTLRALGDMVPILLISAAIQGQYDVVEDTSTVSCRKPFDIDMMLTTIHQMLPAK